MSFKCRFATLDEAYNMGTLYNDDNRSMLEQIRDGERIIKEKKNN